MVTIKVSKPFKPLYDEENHTVILNNPRISGKSYEIAQKASVLTREYPNHDIICCRANANSLEESMVAEIDEKFDLMGMENGKDYWIKKQPLRMGTSNGVGEILFKGISGHDRSRVRSIKPKHKVSAIIIDECQQISSLENLKHALATFRRYLDTSINYKIILAGNPHEVKGHWWNTYCARYKGVKGYGFVDSTYKDIAKLLSEEVLEDIELEKQINPALYKFMYLGDISDINGGAYPSFDRNRHFISWDRAVQMTQGMAIETIIWGGDGAITHDSTAIVPIAIFTNGQAMILERFYFNPLTYGRPLAPSELATAINKYVEWMDKKYGIQENQISSYFIIDCASEDLITQLRYTLDDYHLVKAYTQKNILRNNSAVNNCFARDMVHIIDFNGIYHDWVTDKDVRFTTDPLVEQLESVVWKNNKYDPAIPNDITDAMTYGLAVYYENPDNLYMPERMKTYREN